LCLADAEHESLTLCRALSAGATSRGHGSLVHDGQRAFVGFVFQLHLNLTVTITVVTVVVNAIAVIGVVGVADRPCAAMVSSARRQRVFPFGGRHEAGAH
jgi:Na+-transporting methylmalonyl-CoA/oxaloacetate decarboxylase beta subunit